MSKTLYMVTISSGSLPVDTMVFDNKAQAEAAAEYFKLYYDEECYIIDIEISEITIDTNDYISKLNEYQKQLVEEERDEEEGYIKAEIENSEQSHIRSLFFKGNGFCEKIHRNEHQRCNSAVNIGQNGVAAASDCRNNACKMVCQKVKYIVVILKSLRHCARCCRACLEYIISRNQRKRSKRRR